MGMDIWLSAGGLETARHDCDQGHGKDKLAASHIQLPTPSSAWSPST